MTTNRHAEIAKLLVPMDMDAEYHRLVLAKAVGAVCAVDGCVRPSTAKRLCDLHYRRELRRGRRCPQCDGPMIRRGDEPPSHFLKRTYCSRSCGAIASHLAAEAKYAAEQAELIENVEWLVDSDSPHRIAARLGYDRPTSLAKKLDRAGRHDLANHFRIEVNVA